MWKKTVDEYRVNIDKTRKIGRELVAVNTQLSQVTDQQLANLSESYRTLVDGTQQTYVWLDSVLCLSCHRCCDMFLKLCFYILSCQWTIKLVLLLTLCSKSVFIILASLKYRIPRYQSTLRMSKL